MGIFGKMDPWNDEFELDLTHFEEKNKKAYEDQLAADPDADIEITAPWDDRLTFWDLYSEETIWKGKLLLEANRVEPLTDHSWSVEGSQHYLVTKLESGDMPVPWVVCTCPNGQARGGRPSCYHCAAVHSLVLGIDLSTITEPKKKRPASR